MELISILVDVLILITAIPVGLFLAWLCSDELKDGKKWFRLIFYALVLIGIVFLLVYRNILILMSLAYMVIITAVSLWKGK